MSGYVKVLLKFSQKITDGGAILASCDFQRTLTHYTFV